VTISIIAIVIAVGVLIGYNIISIDVGIIYGALIAVGTILLETVIPTLLNYSITPKVSLKIGNIQLEKKTFHNVEGYLLTALVTNKGKRIALNLDATIQIKNRP
jgi:xanthosine utilization system XapX-like protein